MCQLIFYLNINIFLNTINLMAFYRDHKLHVMRTGLTDCYWTVAKVPVIPCYTATTQKYEAILKN